MAHKDVKLSKKELESRTKRVEREIIEGSDAQQEAYREMAKAGWKADEFYETQEERKAHRAEKREAGKLKAREILRQNMAKKKMIRDKVDINLYTGISSWGKKANNGA